MLDRQEEEMLMTTRGESKNQKQLLPVEVKRANTESTRKAAGQRWSPQGSPRPRCNPLLVTARAFFFFFSVPLTRCPVFSSFAGRLPNLTAIRLVRLPNAGSAHRLFLGSLFAACGIAAAADRHLALSTDDCCFSLSALLNAFFVPCH